MNIPTGLRTIRRGLTRTTCVLGSILVLVVASAAFPATATAADGSAAKNLPVVRFQDWPGFGNLLIRVANSKGWCEAAGIVCKFETIRSAPLGVQALIGGSIDVAQTPISVVAAAVTHGAKIRAVVGSAVSEIFQVDVSNKVSMPHAAQGYPAIMQDLKGHRIGVVARGAATEAFFRFLLEQAGLAGNDVTYVAVGAPMTAFAALRSGRVAAIVSWEPAGTICELSKLCTRVYNGGTATKPALLRKMYGAGTDLVMRSDYIAAHPQIVHAVVKLSQRAAKFVNDPANEAAVLKISAQYSPFDMPHGDLIAHRVYALALKAGTWKPMIRRSAVKATLRYLQQTKQLSQVPSVDQLVWAGAPHG